MATDPIHAWLRRWEEYVRDRDYDAARGLFHPDVVGFGTMADVARGIEELVPLQWRRTWPAIEGFRFDLDGAVIVRSPDGLLATVAVTWRSTGFSVSGVEFERAGRATIVLRRDGVEGQWRAVHTHFSLNRGVPQTVGRRALARGAASHRSG